MTFVATVTDLGTRFLTERSFELIVAPALADFELDIASGDRSVTSARTAVLMALVGAAWEDVVRGGDLALFVSLVLIPVGYYTFFFLLGLPAGADQISFGAGAMLAIAVVMLSLAPAVVCFWPERQSRSSSPHGDLAPSGPASTGLAAAGASGAAPQP